MQKNPKVSEALTLQAGVPWISRGVNSGLWGLGCSDCVEHIASDRKCSDARFSKQTRPSDAMESRSVSFSEPEAADQPQAVDDDWLDLLNLNDASGSDSCVAPIEIDSASSSMSVDDGDRSAWPTGEWFEKWRATHQPLAVPTQREHEDFSLSDTISPICISAKRARRIQ